KNNLEKFINAKFVECIQSTLGNASESIENKLENYLKGTNFLIEELISEIKEKTISEFSISNPNIDPSKSVFLGAALTTVISVVVSYIVADIILYYILGIISGFLNPFLIATTVTLASAGILWKGKG